MANILKAVYVTVQEILWIKNVIWKNKKVTYKMHAIYLHLLYLKDSHISNLRSQDLVLVFALHNILLLHLSKPNKTLNVKPRTAWQVDVEVLTFLVCRMLSAPKECV